MDPIGQSEAGPLEEPMEICEDACIPLRHEDYTRMSFLGGLSALKPTAVRPRRVRLFHSPHKAADGSIQNQLKKYADTNVGADNLRALVRIPDGEDENEWLAMNLVNFFNQVNMLYSVISDLCTEHSCPRMTAGKRYEYQWHDGVKFMRPTPMSAPAYVDNLMKWAQDIIDNENTLPTEVGVPFPPNFKATVKSIVRRLYRIYAHLYYHHFPHYCALRVEAHLNTSYRHFLLFVTEFHLVDAKDLAALQDVNEHILSALQ